MYDSLIGSHLNYGIMSWGFSCKNVEKLQKKAIRNVANCKYNAHSEPIFKNLEILTLKDILNRKIYKFFYRMSNSKLPDYFMTKNWLIKQSGTHVYNTRCNHYKVPKVNHKFAENCIRYKLPVLLNENITSIIEKANTHSEQGFTIYIKKYFLSQYKDQCNITNCYVCRNN